MAFEELRFQAVEDLAVGQMPALVLVTPQWGSRYSFAVMFTDLVGSTALLPRLGDERGEEVRRERFVLMRGRRVDGGASGRTPVLMMVR